MQLLLYDVIRHHGVKLHITMESHGYHGRWPGTKPTAGLFITTFQRWIRFTDSTHCTQTCFLKKKTTYTLLTCCKRSINKPCVALVTCHNRYIIACLRQRFERSHTAYVRVGTAGTLERQSPGLKDQRSVVPIHLLLKGPAAAQPLSHEH